MKSSGEKNLIRIINVEIPGIAECKIWDFLAPELSLTEIHALWCRQKEQGATQQEKNGFEADFQQQVLRRAPEGV